ncbi:MAG: hypothetical protein MUE85_08195 [Microscillaceae bacterium]|jgi:hypothetical protein|nr:hypothetical protein [Microscillaceae bacterium]
MITSEQACLNLLLQSFATKIAQEWQSKYVHYFGEVYKGLAHLPKGMKTKFLEAIEFDIVKTLQNRKLHYTTIEKLQPSIETIERVLIHTEAMAAWEATLEIPQAPNQIFWQIKPNNIKHKVRQALAYYLDYEGWEDFRQQHQLELEQSKASKYPLVCIRREVRQELAPQWIESETSHHSNTYQIPSSTDTPRQTIIYSETQWFKAEPISKPLIDKRYNYLIISILILLLTGLVVIIYQTTGLSTALTKTLAPKPYLYTPAECAKIQFKILKSDIGMNRASFKIYYDLSGAPMPENLRIATGVDFDMWPQTLTKKSDTILIQCYKPSIEIQLRTEYGEGTHQQILKTIKTDVPTLDWIGFAHSNTWGYTSYYAQNELVTKGVLHFPPQKLDSLKRKYYYTDFYNLQDFGVSGDDCTLEVRLKNAPKVEGGTCMVYGVMLIGTENQANYQLAPQGCLSWLEVGLANQIFTEKSPHFALYQAGVLQVTVKKDLGAFSLPEKLTEEWHTMKMRIKNQVAYYYLNDKLIDKIPFEGKIGRVKGLKLHSKGSAWFDFIRLLDEKNQEIYFEDFEDASRPAKPRLGKIITN